MIYQNSLRIYPTPSEFTNPFHNLPTPSEFTHPSEPPEFTRPSKFTHIFRIYQPLQNSPITSIIYQPPSEWAQVGIGVVCLALRKADDAEGRGVQREREWTRERSRSPIRRKKRCGQGSIKRRRYRQQQKKRDEEMAQKEKTLAEREEWDAANQEKEKEAAKINQEKEAANQEKEKEAAKIHQEKEAAKNQKAADWPIQAKGSIGRVEKNKHDEEIHDYLKGLRKENMSFAERKERITELAEKEGWYDEESPNCLWRTQAERTKKRKVSKAAAKQEQEKQEEEEMPGDGLIIAL
jgi:hypothetical protein